MSEYVGNNWRESSQIHFKHLLYTVLLSAMKNVRWKRIEHFPPYLLGWANYNRWRAKWSESHSLWEKVKLESHVQLFVTPQTIYTGHGILQARMLEWVAFPFSKGYSLPRDRMQVYHTAGGFFTSWATRAKLIEKMIAILYILCIFFFLSIFKDVFIFMWRIIA